MKRFLFLALFASSMLCLPSLVKRFTYGFQLAKMRLDFPHHPEWEIEPHPELHPILEQPFRFIGKGAQSYVFESQDGEYVVKLFRYDKPSVEEKIVLLFNACKVAYDFLQKETGLVYIHLNPTPMNLPVLHCTDPIGRKYKFPLDNCRFAVQKKASAFRPTLEKSLHNPKEMQQRIDQFIDLLRSRTEKGIFNADPNLSRNFGFLEDRAVEFDFGNYRKIEGLDKGCEMERYVSKLRLWLKKNAPEWVFYLDEQMAKLK